MKNHQGTSEQVKQVTFSEVSKLYKYDEDRPHRDQMFYSKRDFSIFKRDTYTKAFHLRHRLGASQDDFFFSLREPTSWLPSPQILEEEAEDASTDPLPEELVGLEHILVPERIMVLLNALKVNHRLWLLANVNHPERLRAMIANASNVASHIAQCKAKNVADYRSY